MKTSGLGRAFRYYVRQAEVYAAYIIAGSFVWAAYLWFFSSDGTGFLEAMRSAPGSAVYLSMILLFTSGMTSAQCWYSLPISFGCIRRHAFWGSLTMDILIMAESFLFYEISVRIFNMELLPFGTLIILAAYLNIESLSKLLGIAAMKWGKAVYIIIVILTIAVFISLGFLFSYAAVQKNSPLVPIKHVDGTPTWQWIFLTASAAICVAANLASYHIIKRFEVKA